ncbi:spore germination protein GerW family protein [Halovenus marina]|uniref:spore germination protein GerW family protein n=1 Tax=Halovenus marina TaxID=3396621 RepID=UPI003F54A36E
MEAHEPVQSVLEQMHHSANVKSVFGEPIEANGKTILPVAKISYGFGGGYGSEGGADMDGDESAGSDGGGMGGGLSAKPAGVVEISDDETRFIPFANRKKLVAVALVFALIGYLLGRKA